MQSRSWPTLQLRLRPMPKCAAGRWPRRAFAVGKDPCEEGRALQITGDALAKYADLFEPYGVVLPESIWTPTGRGLLLALQAAWRAGEADPFDAVRHDPACVLPVYTRLSDAEENERARLAINDAKNLVTGVQDAEALRARGDGEGVAHGSVERAHHALVHHATMHHATMHEASVLSARPDEHGVTYQPLDSAHAADVAALEACIMGSDAWSESSVQDELPRTDRTWWAAFGLRETCSAMRAAG